MPSSMRSLSTSPTRPAALSDSYVPPDADRPRERRCEWQTLRSGRMESGSTGLDPTRTSGVDTHG